MSIKSSMPSASAMQQCVAPMVLQSEAIGSPNTLSLTLGTAFQATDPTRSAYVTINVNSVANLTLAVGTTNTADILIGATAAVATGTGTVVGRYRNSLTGTLAVALGANTDQTVTYSLTLPLGWFYAVRQTAGTVTIVSAFDQSRG